MHLGIVFSYRFNTRVVADKLATGLFQIIVDKIITVKYATYAVAKRKPEKKKSGLQGFEPWPLRHRCCALANQLS